MISPRFVETSPLDQPKRDKRPTITPMTPPTTTPAQRRAGLGLHVLTAMGAVTGLLALEAVFDGHIRGALMWLIVCQVLDGIDGPLARSIDVEMHAPKINGHTLDLVVDFVTCVVVPVVLMLHLRVVPHRSEMFIASVMVLTSALWFARTDQETPDTWFNGFPATWNIVVPTLVILRTTPQIAAAIIVVFAFMQLTNVKFPHVVRSGGPRKATYVASALYLGTLTWLSATYPNESGLGRSVLLIAPAYLAFIVVWRTWFPHARILGVTAAPDDVD